MSAVSDSPESHNTMSAEVVGDAPLILLSNRYRVLNVLSDGGFGQTFLVEDTHMPSNRQCVLKQLKPVKDTPELRQLVQDRFQREAAILEKLGDTHEQIPRLYAYFSEADQFYLVEEWVEGATLTEKVDREGPQTEATVQAIISKLLPVIAYIHQQKIVHRDIKPDNIILRRADNLPVLIDFGAVKETMTTLLDSGQHSSNSIVVGTPGYMPSEQLSGRPIYASDLYSLGMTAIFLLTGQPPQNLEADPHTGALNWRQYAPGVSPSFANFIDCATHVSPKSRFSSVQDMQSVLNTLMMGQLATQLPPSPTASVSSQTVVSNSPIGAPNSNSGAASGANSGAPSSYPDSSTYSGQQTAIAAPGQTVSPEAATVNQAGSIPAAGTTGTVAAATSTPTAKQSSEWKGAVIIGGLVGLSIFLGALVMTERLPNVLASRDQGETVTSTLDSSADDSEADEASSQADNEEKADEQTPVSASENSTAPSTPAPTPPVTTAPPAAAPNSNASIIGSGTKNVRAGTGTQFAVVTEVAGGSRVRIQDRGTDSEGYPWYRITTPSGQSGWIAGQLIQIDGDATPPQTKPAPTPTPTPTPRPQPPTDRTNATIVSSDPSSKNIRSGPGTGNSVVHEAYPGDRIIINRSAQDSGGYTWYEVTFPESGARGWIAGQLVRRD